jgi:hypothetical protein
MAHGHYGLIHLKCSPCPERTGHEPGSHPMSAILDFLGLDDYEHLVNLLNVLPHQF